MTAAVQKGARAAPGAEVAAVLVALAFFAFGLWQNRFFFHDDAYISLRYAANLLHHGALDWNPGEPVEGYTNFLHVLLAAGAMALGLGPDAALRAINALSGLALIALMVPAARQVAPGPERAAERALAVVIVGATPGIATWVMGGLEPVLLAALLLAGILGALRIAREGMRPATLALAAGGFSAAVLTRMDAAVVIAAVGAALLPARGPDGRRMLAAGALVVAIPAAVSLAHMAWRYQTYGMLMPLTFAAKTGLPWAERATLLPAYLRTMVAAVPVVYLGALGALLGLGRGLRDPAFRIPAFALAAQLAYVVWSGGDHMPGGRVLLVAVAPAALALLAVLAPRPLLMRRGMLLFVTLVTMGAALTAPERRMDTAAFMGTVIGRHIAAAWPEGSLVALHTAGSTPFFANDRLRFIDMLGLNDRAIAERRDVPKRALLQILPGHFKGDGAYVLARRPDYIIAGVSEGSPVAAGLFLSDVELAEQPGFARCYALHREVLPVPADLFPAAPIADREIIFQYYQRTCP